MASRGSALALCLWIAGCGGGCGGTEGAPVEHARVESAQGDSRAAPRVEADEVGVEPGPRPELRVIGEPARDGRAVALRIENRGSEPAELSGAARLQRRDGDAWANVEGVGLQLRFSCEEPASDCVTLAPGAIYLPPPWLGTLGDAQCDCERCVPAPAGDYRVVVQSCSRAHTIEGESFAINTD